MSWSDRFFFTGLILIIGVPILTIVLGEASEHLTQRGNPLGKFFQDAPHLPLASLGHCIGDADAFTLFRS